MMDLQPFEGLYCHNYIGEGIPEHMELCHKIKINRYKKKILWSLRRLLVRDKNSLLTTVFQIWELRVVWQIL